MKKLLEVKSLVKKYREGTRESRVVNNIDLEVEEGEFVIIMGASGSGKTSLLHLIAGIDAPDEGTIQYGRTADFGCMSESAKTIFRRKNIGIVFQQQCLIPDLTVYENMILPIMLNKKDAGKNKDVILALCNQFGLKEHIKKYPSQLSGGQQQRAAILRAVINRPSLLLCDEPTGSLNSAQSKIVMALLTKLNQMGQTIVLVTHDMKVAVRGGRVVYIADGRVTGELTFGKDVQRKSREVELMRFLQQRGW
ncbi:MAG: ABC transporter ATP-binding protein [Lachnospiraceae bacterium]|nr:ABC transporter ATP-binding protein [Lachnospiraceae bacterium]